MKVIKRNNFIYNQIFFVLLSFVYMHITFALDADISAVDLTRFKILIISMPLLSGFCVITILALVSVRKVSIYLLSALTLLVFYKTFSLFLIGYDKLLLVLIVVYLLVSYNMILLLKEELEQAIYNPMFSKNSMDVASYGKINITIIKNDIEHEGSITNFDNQGFTVKLADNASVRGKIAFKIELDGHTFTGEGEVATLFESGFGVRISKKSPDYLGWEELYNIIYRRGYQ